MKEKLLNILEIYFILLFIVLFLTFLQTKHEQLLRFIGGIFALIIVIHRKRKNVKNNNN